MSAPVHEVGFVGVKWREEIGDVETVGVHASHGACGGSGGERADTRETATAPPTSEPVPGELEREARKLLADELNADEGDFKLDSSARVDWSDASLGCPKEGMGYAQVITPGYKLVFDLSGTSFAVHTNSDGSHMVICRDGQ